VAAVPFLVYFYMVEDDFELKIFRLVPVIVSLVLQFGLVFQISQYSTLTELSYKAVNKQIKVCLKRKILCDEIQMLLQLRKLVSFMSMINLNIKLINNFLNPSIVVWVLKVVAILILNTYLGIILFDRVLRIDMMMLHLRSFLAILAIIYLIHRTDLIGQQVRH
jgi:hypothetical protein